MIKVSPSANLYQYLPIITQIYLRRALIFGVHLKLKGLREKNGQRRILSLAVVINQALAWLGK
jgi:hypothetical protein